MQRSEYDNVSIKVYDKNSFYIPTVGICKVFWGIKWRGRSSISQ